MESKFLSLNWKDIAKGILVAVLTPIFVIVQESLEQGLLTFNWKSIAIAGVSGGLAYLLKNFFTKPTIDAQAIATPRVPKPQ